MPTVAATSGGELHEAATVDQTGRPIRAGWLALPNGTALIEAASACGLHLVRPDLRRPEMSSTVGVGRLIKSVVEQGHERVIVGLGGTATVDGGLGAALGMGATALDDQGEPVTVRGPVDHGEVSTVTPVDLEVEITIAIDVTNPLLGEHGAARVFGPQKGADPTTVDFLEARMRHLADVVEASLPGGPWRDVPGAGAAGGLGFGLLAWTGAAIVPGARLVADLIDLDYHVDWCELVVTGEGSLDAQTLEGKAPDYVAGLARDRGRRIAAIAGRTDGSAASTFEHIEQLGTEGLIDPHGAVRRAAMRLARAIR